jgi:hypothetical protein
MASERVTRYPEAERATTASAEIRPPAPWHRAHCRNLRCGCPAHKTRRRRTGAAARRASWSGPKSTTAPPERADAGLGRELRAGSSFPPARAPTRPQRRLELPERARRPARAVKPLACREAGATRRLKSQPRRWPAERESRTATCVRLLDPAGTRARAPPPTNGSCRVGFGSNCASGRDGEDRMPIEAAHLSSCGRRFSGRKIADGSAGGGLESARKPRVDQK